MYFSLIPDLQYDKKPISYPFSESDFIITKNFFRRYQVNPDLFDYAVFYTKYSVEDGQRIENIAQEYYGDAFYDWVIALTNNFINPLFAFPLDSETLRSVVEEKYGEVDAYSGIHHYETEKIYAGYMLDGVNVVALEGGLVVDETFYTTPFSYWNGEDYTTISGNVAATPVTNYDYEVAQNEAKREIYILRDQYFPRFVEEFKLRNLYGDSSDFVSKRLKKTSL